MYMLSPLRGPAVFIVVRRSLMTTVTQSVWSSGLHRSAVLLRCRVFRIMPTACCTNGQLLLVLRDRYCRKISWRFWAVFIIRTSKGHVFWAAKLICTYWLHQTHDTRTRLRHNIYSEQTSRDEVNASCRVSHTVLRHGHFSSHMTHNSCRSRSGLLPLCRTATLAAISNSKAEGRTIPRSK